MPPGRLNNREEPVVFALKSQPEPRQVLIVEDNKDSRKSLRFLLESHGHWVDVAATGPEGVRAGVTRPYDAAIIDLGLPGLDGLQVARALGAGRSSAIALIAYTAYDEADKRAQATGSGFDEYLIKPRDLPVLLRWFNPERNRGA
jgi:CheY-like chemotaxis protein